MNFLPKLNFLSIASLLLVLFLSQGLSAQNKITSVTFTSNSSTDFDTLFATIDLNIDLASVENYVLNLSLKAIEEGDTVNVNFIEVVLEEFEDANVSQINFNEAAVVYDIVIAVRPTANYLFQVSLHDLQGVLIEQSLIIAE